MNKNKLDLLLLGMAHSLNHSLFLVLPPLLERITQDLGTNLSTMGLISTITFLTYGAGAMLGGPLSDRLGSLRVARISIGLGGFVGLIFLVANNAYVFGLAMFLMALWASFYHPTANGLIAKAFPENTGGAMGIHNAAGNFGQVLTPTIAYFLGVFLNWRLSFVFFGILSLLIAWLLDRIEVEEGKSGKRELTYVQFLRIPNLWIVLLYNVLVGFLFRSVDLFFPTFLSKERGLSGGLAAIANSLILLTGVAGQILGGRSSDRFGKTKTLMVATAGMLLSLSLLMIVPINRIGVIIFIMLYGVSMFGHQPIVTSMVSILSPRSMMGLSYGFMFFSAFGVGSLSTTITGYLAEKYSLSAAFWLNTGISAILLIVSLALWLRYKDHARVR
ncbi:MFS transporter [Candidatus Bathyarchaeota archaeon]|nr:MFS transporter [Candidatus Bathyarchaeota archaeon]